MENKKGRFNVWWLSATSFFTDISSEMIFPILPIFLKDVLGASFGLIGLIEGLAEGLGSILKYFSGYLSDKIHKRKGLTLLGYSISALSKLFFALAQSPLTVLFFRSLDRTGKGVRTSPRDALIAESVNESERGKYFGIHRASDTAGAVIGTLIAVGLLFYFDNDIVNAIRSILLISFIPAAIGVLLLLFVREPKFVVKSIHQLADKKKLFQFGRFSRDFKIFLVAAALFGLANYSYSFYILRANDVGVMIAFIPLIYLIYNIFYALSSYPAGRLSDKIGRAPVLIGAFVLFAALNLAFAFEAGKLSIWFLFALYGLFIGLTDGVFKAFVSDLVSRESQGEGFGIYHTVIGFATLFGNLGAGLIWQTYGAIWPFIISAVLIILAGLIILIKFFDHRGMKGNYDIRHFKSYRG
ncbi:MAG: MFS transporter [Patescibacteria group bacterium]